MFRFAHKDDFFKGMYNSNYASYYLQAWIKTNKEHPMPYNDVLLVDYYESLGASKDHLYAFANTKQLQAWLDDEDIESLKDEGYVMWRIEPLDDAIQGYDYEIGESQMIFDSRKFKWEKEQ